MHACDAPASGIYNVNPKVARAGTCQVSVCSDFVLRDMVYAARSSAQRHARSAEVRSRARLQPYTSYLIPFQILLNVLMGRNGKSPRKNGG